MILCLETSEICYFVSVYLCLLHLSLSLSLGAISSSFISIIYICLLFYSAYEIFFFYM